jgi:hypothetical protein
MFDALYNYMDYIKAYDIIAKAAVSHVPERVIIGLIDKYQYMPEAQWEDVAIGLYELNRTRSLAHLMFKIKAKTPKEWVQFVQEQANLPDYPQLED